jgi:hypothetical protein
MVEAIIKSQDSSIRVQKSTIGIIFPLKGFLSNFCDKHRTAAPAFYFVCSAREDLNYLRHIPRIHFAIGTFNLNHFIYAPPPLS